MMRHTLLKGQVLSFTDTPFEHDPAATASLTTDGGVLIIESKIIAVAPASELLQSAQAWKLSDCPHASVPAHWASDECTYKFLATAL